MNLKPILLILVGLNIIVIGIVSYIVMTRSSTKHKTKISYNHRRKTNSINNS